MNFRKTESMDIFESSWFGVAERKMDWAAARQRILTENVANADTPGFVGRDVVSFDEHLSRNEAGARTEVDSDEASNAWGGSFDGNRVVLEEQSIMSTETAGQYQMASRLYRKGHELLSLAVSSK